MYDLVSKSKRHTRDKWSDDEVATLIKYGGKVRTKDLYKAIPGRTPNAIRKKAQKMHIDLRVKGRLHHEAKYTKEQIDAMHRLAKLEPPMTVREMCEIVGIDCVFYGYQIVRGEAR